MAEIGRDCALDREPGTLRRVKVGVVVPLAEDPENGAPAPAYREIRRVATAAEDGGLDSVWVYDHLLFAGDDGAEPSGLWEAWTLLAALGDATERVEIGTLVLCTSFRNPGLLAKMAATLDEVSAGRLILGIGCGWHEPEFEAFGYDFDHRVDQFDDSIRILKGLLRDGRVEHDGRRVRANAVLRPRGPRAAGPPILVSSRGPRMNRLTARFADQWNDAWYGAPAQRFRDRLDALRRACDEVGRDVGEIGITVGVTVEDPERAVFAPTIGAAPVSALRGDAPAIAEGLAVWRALGVSHVICRLDPPDPETVGLVAEAARLVR